MTEFTNIPNPDCPRCDGVGWYEGGPTIQTNCHCLRKVKRSDANKYVLGGTFSDWRWLYIAADKGNELEFDKVYQI